MLELERVALSLPEAQKELRDDDRPAYVVDRKLFCFHRTPRNDAIDAVTGERFDDVFAFRVADDEMKSMWLGERADVIFTTDHFNGYPWVLLRIPSLSVITDEELVELVTDAWLACAPKRLARTWLSNQGLTSEDD